MLNLEAAKKVQELLSKRVVLKPLPPVETVGGLDVSYAGGLAYGVAVVVKVDGLQPVEVAYSINKSAVPYVPTFLAFREITPMLRAYLKLRNKPDVILVDGHGLAHPRRFGIASHIGVVLGKPTIGVAKSRLYGEERGEALIDPSTGEEIGRVIHCGGKKRYVSVGSYATLEDAAALVEKLCKNGEIVPVDLAHRHTQLAKRIKPEKFDQWGEALLDY